MFTLKAVETIKNDFVSTVLITSILTPMKPCLIITSHKKPIICLDRLQINSKYWLPSFQLYTKIEILAKTE